jgi:class 3 adenylate cyclase
MTHFLGCSLQIPTHLSDVKRNQSIPRLLESYSSIFLDLIQKNGGDVNEMAGDGMMAFI